MFPVDLPVELFNTFFPVFFPPPVLQEFLNVVEFDHLLGRNCINLGQIILLTQPASVQHHVGIKQY